MKRSPELWYRGQRKSWLFPRSLPDMTFTRPRSADLHKKEADRAIRGKFWPVPFMALP